MSAPEIDRIRARLDPIRRALLEHPIYARIDGLPALRLFMEHHVFAVWDFMSLLKTLQRQLCSVSVPWTPSPRAEACRLINEVVLGEESDDDGEGGFASHFELYRKAMRRCGASTIAIDRLVDQIGEGREVSASLEASESPIPARRFVDRTFEIIAGAETHAIASAFAFGREDLLPDVFRRIVNELDSTSGADLGGFRYYLDRHIELDGDSHGPMAARLVSQLCGHDQTRWRAAEDAAVGSLEARLTFWDGIHERLVADHSAENGPG